MDMNMNIFMHIYIRRYLHIHIAMSEEGATQMAADLARPASRSRPDTVNEPPRLIKRRNGLITEFTRAAWHYWVAETNAERHSILLRWTLEQARLMEVKSSGSKSMDHTSGSQDIVRNGSPKTNIEVPGSPFQSNSACACEKISWVESRKPTDDSERSNRQSLPSISELVSGAKSSFYPPTPCSSLQPDNSLSSLLTSTPRPKPEIEKPSSLQTAHSALLFSPQQDALPATDSPRVPFSGLSSPPPASGRRPGPSPEFPPPHHDPGPPKPPEPPRPFNEVYAHPLPAPQALVHYQPDQLPPGQMPLLAYPISPRHAIPTHAPKLYDPGPVPHSEEEDSSARARKDETVKRYFDSSMYEDLLSRVSFAFFKLRTWALLIEYLAWKLVPNDSQFCRGLQQNRARTARSTWYSKKTTDGTRGQQHAWKHRTHEALVGEGQGSGGDVDPESEGWRENGNKRSLRGRTWCVNVRRQDDASTRHC